MSRNRILVLITAVVVALAITGAAAIAVVGIPSGQTKSGSGSGSTATASPSASSTALKGGTTNGTASADRLGAAFLKRYVDDGRVIRRDQGGDTVSEGQAYGMLIALGIGDEKSFASIWSWTKKHLQEKNGLMAWRYQNGKVVDDQPASDADLDMARALLVAGDRMDDAQYTADGKALASAIADEMTATTALGRILLPGPWAAGVDPYAYNPSYASPAAFDLIGSYTGDPRWAELTAGSRAASTAILAKAALPPDWAQIHGDGTIDFMPGARGTGQSVRYSYDAARLPIRYAESCQAADRALAAKTADPLDRSTTLDADLDLGGTPISNDKSPLSYIARASARAAAGDDSGARADLKRAQKQAAAVPTYYGDAWNALGAIELTTDAVGGCAPLGGSK